MKKDSRIFLKHILESIEDIETYLEGFSEEQFSRDTKTQSAVLRKLEVIGEAVKNLPFSFKKRYPDIKWREFAGMRDKLIHQYFGVDMKIVWETSREDITELKREILRILESLEK